MGCGTSKSVRVAKTNSNKVDASKTTPINEITSPKCECIDGENGETLTWNPTTERTSPDGRIEVSRVEVGNFSVEDTAHQRLQGVQQELPSEDDNEKLSIFHIIRDGVYIDDLKKMIFLKTRSWELEEEIRVAISLSEKPPPAISEREGLTENPRRIRPPRHFLREKAIIVSLELVIVFGILTKNSYTNDVISMLEKLRQRESELTNELEQVKFSDKIASLSKHD